MTVDVTKWITPTRVLLTVMELACLGLVYAQPLPPRVPLLNQLLRGLLPQHSLLRLVEQNAKSVNRLTRAWVA